MIEACCSYKVSEEVTPRVRRVDALVPARYPSAVKLSMSSQAFVLLDLMICVLQRIAAKHYLQIAQSNPTHLLLSSPAFFKRHIKNVFFEFVDGGAAAKKRPEEVNEDQAF